MRFKRFAHGETNFSETLNGGLKKGTSDCVAY